MFELCRKTVCFLSVPLLCRQGERERDFALMLLSHHRLQNTKFQTHTQTQSHSHSRASASFLAKFIALFVLDAATQSTNQPVSQPSSQTASQAEHTFTVSCLFD